MEIIVNSQNTKFGYIHGVVKDENEEYSFSLSIERNLNSKYKNNNIPENLNGKLKNFQIFKTNSSVEGNPYLPSMSFKAVVYASFAQGQWEIRSWKVYDITNFILDYFNKKHSIKLLSIV